MQTRMLWAAGLLLALGACTGTPAAQPAPEPTPDVPTSTTEGVGTPPSGITLANAIGYCRNALLLLEGKDTWSPDEATRFETCRGDFAAGAQWASTRWAERGTEPPDEDRADAAAAYAQSQTGPRFAAFVVATAYVTWFIEDRPIDWTTAQPTS